jgi:ubiquinone/menaquinone biosynthesis C-methylase UbiE
MSSYYDARFKFDPKRRVVWNEIVAYLSNHIPSKGTVVDLGAGYCDFINAVNAKRRIAIDISDESAHYCHPEVEFLRSSVLDLSVLSDSSIDVVHASNLLEHFNDDDLEKLIAEIYRILSPSGKLILLQPNYRLAYKYYFDDYTHKKVWTHVSLRDFLTANKFKAVKDYTKFLPFSMKSSGSLPVFPFVIRAYLHSPWKPFAGQMLLVSQVNK